MTQQDISIKMEEGGSIRSYLYTWLVGIVIGVVSGGVAMQSCMHTPAELYESRTQYRTTITKLEEAVDAERREASLASAQADRFSDKALELQQEIDRMDITRPLFLDDPAPAIPTVVIVNASQEIAARLRSFEGAFTNLQSYAISLERRIELEQQRSIALETALANRTEAYKHVSAALAASEERAVTAELRVKEWERVSIPRKKAYLIIGGTVAAIFAANKAIGAIK